MSSSDGSRVLVMPNNGSHVGVHHRDGDGEVEIEDTGEEESVEDPSAPLKFRFNFRKLWRYMGPGWLMSLAYLDPGNLESDLQQGAYTNLRLVWVLWWATVIGLVLQELAARLGVVTGKDLAQHVRQEYPRWLNYAVYTNMEIAVIASDIQEVVGSGIAINLISNGAIPVWVGCIITGADTFTFLAVHYVGIRYLEALICFLIACMSVSFFINWGETKVDAAALVKGWIVPTMPFYALTQAISTIGAVIMPHNLYLHSGLVLSRRVDRSSARKVHEATWYNFLESALALLCSFFINLAIVATNAGQFFDSSCAVQDGGPYACISNSAVGDADTFGSCPLPYSPNTLGSCAQIGLENEGSALKHGIGNFALYVWAFGLLAAGQAATMTCTYAGQIIMGGCLEIQLAPWKRVAFTRAIALGPSIAVAASTVGNSTLFSDINEWLNVLQSVQLPFAMLPLMHLCSKERIMSRFRSSNIVIFINMILAGIVFVGNAVLIVQFCEGFPTNGIIAVCVYACFYLALCGRMLYPCSQSSSAAGF